MAVANPDLEHIVRTVQIRQIRTTPVLIAQQISWVPPQSLANVKVSLDKLLDVWSRAKSGGDATALGAFYAPDFSADGRDLAAHQAMLRADVARLRGRAMTLKDVSILGWSEGADVRVGHLCGDAGRRPDWKTGAPVLGATATGRRGDGWKVVYETELR